MLKSSKAVATEYDGNTMGEATRAKTPRYRTQMSRVLKGKVYNGGAGINSRLHPLELPPGKDSRYSLLRIFPCIHTPVILSGSSKTFCKKKEIFVDFRGYEYIVKIFDRYRPSGEGVRRWAINSTAFSKIMSFPTTALSTPISRTKFLISR